MDLNALIGKEGARMSVSKDDLVEGWKFKHISSTSTNIPLSPMCTHKLMVHLIIAYHTCYNWLA